VLLFPDTSIQRNLFQNPFEHLYRDSDVEGMTDGFDERTAYGGIEGFDDPSMGWSRYAQYYKHFNFNRCDAGSATYKRGYKRGCAGVVVVGLMPNE